MRRKTVFIFLVLTVLTSGLLVTGIFKKITQRKESVESVRTLPLFKLDRINGDEFSSGEIRKGPVLIVFFHPDCEYCRYEVNDLVPLFNNAGDLISILISHAPFSIIQEFVEKAGLRESDRMVILSDEELAVRELFGVKNVPAILIYDRNLRIVKRFDGEVKSETISKYLYGLD